MYKVRKREGKIVSFKIEKIQEAIKAAMDAEEKNYTDDIIDFLSLKVTSDFQDKIKDDIVNVEDIQDSVEKVLIHAGYDDVAKEFSGLRIIPFPLSQEQFTFKHYKYTTHILTAQNSAYRAPDLPGGSMTNLMGVSRYTNAAVQGIQSQLKISNAEQYIQL